MGGWAKAPFAPRHQWRCGGLASLSPPYGMTLALASSSQFPEESPHLVSERLRLFECCKMSAPGHDAPAANVGEHARRGRARRFEDFARKLRVAGGHRNRIARGQDRRTVKAGLIGPERRADRTGKPIKRYVGQHAVPADRALNVAIAIEPRAEFLHNPCSEASGRIREAEGKRLWARALDPLITSLFTRPVRKLAQVTPLLLGRIGKGGRIAACGHHQIDVDADHPIRMRIAKPARYRGSPVATLRAEAVIAEDVMHKCGYAIGYFGNAEPSL